MMSKSLILITGGARSGKSHFAEQRAAALSAEVLFVATAEAGDAEMATRIANHRATRPAHWRTLEEPRHVARALHAAAPAPLVLLDCVTLWVTNLLLAEAAQLEPALHELEALLDWWQNNSVTLIVVSNEVGLGIVPDNALSREFRDWLGIFNQRLAAEADTVYLMVAGLPLTIKTTES